MKGKHIIHAPVLVKRLLQNFIDQDKISSAYGINQNHSLVIGLAFNLWSILTFRNRTADDLTVNDKNDFQEAPLAVQSLFPSLDDTRQPLSKQPLFIYYMSLYKNGSSDAITLLLYVLLHRNSSFKSYLLTRPDLDQLIIPILRTLYNAPNSTSHHIYMSLIILLILSEDDSFNKMVHEKKLKNITWYTEKALTDISLGGILILVVIRIVQYNILKMRDKYLHTNCLAALANMSSQFRELHPYVCQRLVSIFGYLSKKYKSTNELKRDKNKKNLEVAVTVNENATELEQDLQVLEEVLRMILEILNSCLSTNLANNPNLIYTLLYNKHIFESLKDNVVFQDIIHNIVVVINHFSQLLVQKSQYEVDTHQVLIVIQQGIKSWSKEKLVKFPDLKFKYVEEDRPEDFFHSLRLGTSERTLSVTLDE
ncbi:hypothetical protein NQ318_013077 [Aromia moschata]|uniref:Dymeclin n=1 Tax=Aromia moschata TaxID=1265417 RepID=A0AAV8Y1Q2_9CUCU|nr:hypothetical protein NQ318_013077 [Aromia moschata]